MADKKHTEPDNEEEEGVMSNLASKVKNLFMSKSSAIDHRLASPDIGGLVEYMKSDKCKNIITMAGAGISTSAGIPDFRSPKSGLYDNLEQYNLPHPMAIFHIDYFKYNPEPFFALSKKLFPKEFMPTPCHKFVRLLQEKGLLLRHYTQNVDTLEYKAGILEEKIVEAHGSFQKSHCTRCKKEYTLEWLKEQVFSDKIPKCEVAGCGNVVKPDVVFFGENLPSRFYDCVSKDFKKCDLLIIMGTSLTVQPFASLVSKVEKDIPRLYINRDEPPGYSFFNLFTSRPNFEFGKKKNYRDVFMKGACDEMCLSLAENLGWMDEYKMILNSF